MEIQWKKNVRVISDLEVGDKVRTDGWGQPLDGITHIIESVEQAFGKCESGFLVTINNHHSPLDSNWLDKVK